jgi:hypothetical protein
MQTQLSNALVSAQADALARLLDNGYLRIYNGTQPSGADTAVSTQTLLAELRFSDPCAPASAQGVLTFNAITADSSANASGIASWFRSFKADGTTAVMDGTVGATGTSSNLELASEQIVLGATISITSFTHSVLKSSTGL